MLWTKRELKNLIIREILSAGWRELHELYTIALRYRGISYIMSKRDYQKSRRSQLELPFDGRKTNERDD